MPVERRVHLVPDRHREAVLRAALADYDRRMENPWGRFLLWLLRRTT